MRRPRVAVAASGGRDSTALLHCTLRQARDLGADVVALHVHHGLMPQADAWLKQVRQQSRRWGASFACTRLTSAPARGQSVEAWARDQRYQALACMAKDEACSLVLLAHHRLDQAETWLLQALRGATAAGLAAMPERFERDGVSWARPWLDQSAEAIAAYVKRHRLSHVHDTSNADPRFARSRLRQAVWPALSSAFPNAETSLSAAAQHAQEALALAREAAAADLSVLADDEGLVVAAWLKLPPARRKNALKAWLLAQTGSPPPQSLLLRLQDELSGAAVGSWPLAPALLRLYRGHLIVQRDQHADAAALTSPPVAVDLSLPGRVPVPQWMGVWRIRSVSVGGVSPHDLAELVAAPRQGGEKFRLSPEGTARSLKKQYQALGVPAWQRQGPLLFTAQGRLVFVPGLGPEALFQAAAGAPQLSLEWIADPKAAAGERQAPG